MNKAPDAVPLRSVEDLADAKELRAVISAVLVTAPINEHALRCAVWTFVGVERCAGVPPARRSTCDGLKARTNRGANDMSSISTGQRSRGVQRATSSRNAASSGTSTTWSRTGSFDSTSRARSPSRVNHGMRASASAWFAGAVKGGGEAAAPGACARSGPTIATAASASMRSMIRTPRCAVQPTSARHAAAATSAPTHGPITPRRRVPRSCPRPGPAPAALHAPGGRRPRAPGAAPRPRRPRPA